MITIILYVRFKIEIKIIIDGLGLDSSTDALHHFLGPDKTGPFIILLCLTTLKLDNFHSEDDMQVISYRIFQRSGDPPP